MSAVLGGCRVTCRVTFRVKMPRDLAFCLVNRVTLFLLDEKNIYERERRREEEYLYLQWIFAVTQQAGIRAGQSTFLSHIYPASNPATPGGHGDRLTERT